MDFSLLWLLFGHRTRYIRETNAERSERLSREAAVWALFCDFLMSPAAKFLGMMLFFFMFYLGMSWLIEATGACEVSAGPPGVLAYQHVIDGLFCQ